MPPPSVPLSPPASPPLVSADECQAIIEVIRVARPADAGAAYNLRGWYQAILAYATTARDPAPLYDFWWAVEAHRDVLGRGFYLDLWDLFDQAGAGRVFDEADGELLRYYVCQINADFVSLLSPADDVGWATAWQRRIADLAASPATVADTVGGRRLLYSVLNLYADLYPDVADGEGLAELERQLAAAAAARGCSEPADAPLLRPQEALAGPTDDPARTALVHVLAFAYRSLAHFGVVPLPELIGRLVERLGGEDGMAGRQELMLRLFKFWAAGSPLVHQVLREKCGYEFHTPPVPRPITLPAYHGTDNFVCLVGEREVGKTAFMFASEAASKLPPAVGRSVPELAVRHDSREEIQVDSERKKWLAKEPSKTGNQSLYAQTSVSGLCRFTFYDIGGEELYHRDRPGPSPWLQDHFEKRKPCALLMMFEPTTSDVGRYARLVELLELHLGARDGRYRDLPIYFVLNKADRHLVGDESPRRELARFLQAEEPLVGGFRFPTIRYEEGVLSAADVGDRLSNTPACCRNLAFLDVLLEDLRRLSEVVDACFQRGYTNLSFVYTTCLPGKGSDYGSVRALWSDLAEFLGVSTVDGRKELYHRAFADQIDEHFGFADELARLGSISQDRLALTNSALAGHVAAASDTQGVVDFNALLRAGQPEFDPARNLPPESGYHAIKALLDSYTINKKKLEKELDVAIPALFQELGVPIGKDVIHLLEHHYQAPLDDHLQPGPSGSTSVTRFLISESYKASRKEFERLLLAAADQYNTEHPKDRVFDGAGPTGSWIADALGTLDGALWNVDAVGRQEVRFNPRYGSLNTLCPYKDRTTTDDENDAMNAFGGGERLDQVIRNHTEPVRWSSLIRLFKHFVPRYPPFAYTKRYDLDGFKAAVLNRLRERRMKLDEEAEKLVACLLGVCHELQKEGQNPGDICKQFQAKYLIQMLDRNGFLVDSFLKNPIQFRADLSNSRTSLEQAIGALGFMRDDTKRLGDQLTAYNDAVSKVDETKYSLRRDTLKVEGQEAMRRLDVAEAVFAHVSALVGGRWKSLEEMQNHRIPNFALPQLVLYNRDLDDYVRARKFLILRERAQYLVEAGWLDRLDPADRQFYQSSLDPTTFLGGTRPDAPPEDIAREFKQGIHQLREKDGLWRYSG